MRFQDIQRFPHANYVVDIMWESIEATLESYNTQGQLDLNPDFQRLHVWTEKQQRDFVLYILQGGIAGRDIYFNAADWYGGKIAPMYLVDGKQRLEAVRRFLRDDLYIMPDWMPYSHPLGLRYSDFEGRLPLHAGFKFHVNALQTYGEVVQWYYNLNAGGTPHTQEELDKALKIMERLKIERRENTK